MRRELVSKPAKTLQKSWGGYRRTTPSSSHLTGVLHHLRKCSRWSCARSSVISVGTLSVQKQKTKTTIPEFLWAYQQLTAGSSAREIRIETRAPTHVHQTKWSIASALSFPAVSSTVRPQRAKHEHPFGHNDKQVYPFFETANLTKTLPRKLNSPPKHITYDSTSWSKYNAQLANRSLDKNLDLTVNGSKNMSSFEEPSHGKVDSDFVWIFFPSS